MTWIGKVHILAIPADKEHPVGNPNGRTHVGFDANNHRFAAGAFPDNISRRASLVVRRRQGMEVPEQFSQGSSIILARVPAVRTQVAIVVEMCSQPLVLLGDHPGCQGSVIEIAAQHDGHCLTAILGVGPVTRWNLRQPRNRKNKTRTWHCGGNRRNGSILLGIRIARETNSHGISFPAGAKNQHSDAKRQNHLQNPLLSH